MYIPYISHTVDIMLNKRSILDDNHSQISVHDGLVLYVPHFVRSHTYLEE